MMTNSRKSRSIQSVAKRRKKGGMTAQKAQNTKINERESNLTGSASVIAETIRFTQKIKKTKKLKTNEMSNNSSEFENILLAQIDTENELNLTGGSGLIDTNIQPIGKSFEAQAQTIFDGTANTQPDKGNNTCDKDGNHSDKENLQMEQPQKEEKAENKQNVLIEKNLNSKMKENDEKLQKFEQKGDDCENSQQQREKESLGEDLSPDLSKTRSTPDIPSFIQAIENVEFDENLEEKEIQREIEELKEEYFEEDWPCRCDPPCEYIPTDKKALRSAYKLARSNTLKNAGYENIKLKISSKVYFKKPTAIYNEKTCKFDKPINGKGKIKFVPWTEEISLKMAESFKELSENKQVAHTLQEQQTKAVNPQEKQINFNSLFESKALFDLDDSDEERNQKVQDRTVSEKISLSDITNKKLSNKKSKSKYFQADPPKKETITVKRYLDVEGDINFFYNLK